MVGQEQEQSRERKRSRVCVHKCEREEGRRQEEGQKNAAIATKKVIKDKQEIKSQTKKPHKTNIKIEGENELKKI